MTAATTSERTTRTQANEARAVRALHVYATLDRGGAETWLMDVVRNTPRAELLIDVCVTGAKKGAYEDEFVSLGGVVHRCRMSRNPLIFQRRFRELLSQHRYDVVHSHLYYFSGVVLRAAARAGVKQRVAHNHPVEDLKRGNLLRTAYTAWMRRWIGHYGTDFVGPTRASLESFWGPGWAADRHKRVLYNGVDIARFARPGDRDGVRKELRLPSEARIVLTVGRFVPHKRQEFLIDVARQLLPRHADVYFVCIGDGPLRDHVERRIAAEHLADRFRLIRGLPSIDPHWLASDVFVFPSINEGFGIVVAEAAAAGLPVVACDIPGLREAAVACDSPVLLPIDASSARWAEAVENALNRPRLDLTAREKRLASFPYTIAASISTLRDLYGMAGRERTSRDV